MTNILLNSFRIAQPWCYDTLAPYIRSSDRVLVFPLAFREHEITSIQEWNDRYDKTSGYMAKGFAAEFSRYGIEIDQITWVNFFTDDRDSVAEKISESSILYFSGGLPHLMSKRLRAMDVEDVIRSFDGLIMGDSAGALIQLDSYHVTPDRDYPEYAYYEGLDLIHGFDLEVHYCGSTEQNNSIRRCIQEKGIPVYAMPEQSGVIVECGEIMPFGETTEIACLEDLRWK